MATLEVFTEGHKVICNEVSELNDAVAELFRKCEALQGELREQIVKANIVKERINTITGEDSADDDEPVSEDMLIRNRIRAASERQKELASRMEKIKRRLGRATSRELSDKEKAWSDEVRALESSILGSETDQNKTTPSPATPRAKQPWKRFDEIKSLRDALFAQAEQLQKTGEGRGAATDEGGRPASPVPGIKIPAEIRKAKMAQVIGLLDRETALVDAVKARIERLSLG